MKDKYVLVWGAEHNSKTCEHYHVSTHRERVKMLTSNKDECLQGTWYVRGVPAGGFNIHKISDLKIADQQW